MSEPTPAQILALTMNVEQGTITIRERLTDLLGIVWSDPMGFDGKRPWGFSTWLWDFYNPMIEAGFMAEDERERGHHLITEAIKALATEWIPTAPKVNDGLTVGELDALPDGEVVMDGVGEAHQKFAGRWDSADAPGMFSKDLVDGYSPIRRMVVETPNDGG